MDINTPIHCQLAGSLSRLQQLRYHMDLPEHTRDERLAAKSWIDRHDQDYIKRLDDLFEHTRWCCWVQRAAALLPHLSDELHGPVQMQRSLLVDNDRIRTGTGKSVHIPFRLLDHQMYF